MHQEACPSDRSGARNAIIYVIDGEDQTCTIDWHPPVLGRGWRRTLTCGAGWNVDQRDQLQRGSHVFKPVQLQPRLWREAKVANHHRVRFNPTNDEPERSAVRRGDRGLDGAAKGNPNRRIHAAIASRVPAQIITPRGRQGKRCARACVRVEGLGPSKSTPQQCMCARARRKEGDSYPNSPTPHGL